MLLCNICNCDVLLFCLRANNGGNMEPVGGSWSFFGAVSKQFDDIKNAITNLSLNSVEDTKKNLTQSNLNKPSIQNNPKNTPSFNFESEINILNKSISQAVMKESDDDVKIALTKFKSEVMKNCIANKNDINKIISAERYVNTILDVIDNNPKIKNICMEQFSVSTLHKSFAYALLTNLRFKPIVLNENQAKVILKNGMDVVSSFNKITPTMHNNLCELTTISNLSGGDLEVFIEKAIVVLNFDLAESLVKLNDGKLPNKGSFMDRAVREHDLDIALFVVKHEGNAVVEELIGKMVEGNLENLVNDILIKTGQTLSEVQIANFCKKAELQGNLSLMKVLKPSDWKDQALLEFKSVPKEAKTEKLMHYFLNSNIKETDEFVGFIKENNLISEDLLKEFTKFTATSGRLISRFPNPLEQKEVHAEYGKNYIDYEKQQEGYGNNRLEVVNELITALKKDPAKSLESCYLKLITKAPIDNQVAVTNPWRNGTSFTPIMNRYSMFKKLANEKFSNDYESKNVSLDPAKNSVNISYTSSIGESFKLTTLTAHSGYEAALSFLHSEPTSKDPVNPQWLDQLAISEDWNEIVNMTVDSGNQQSMRDFKNKVAEFYWKGVQLMPTDRGNSQTMLELHYTLYQLKGLEPPALSRYAILPDCVALCSTLEEFQDRYDGCWDH